mmetsp:Transcript_6745/g.22269  ORF Transcript_6745/g.22269 Transcript_6745/m.22269 type:complete len:213 (+) Transcript_6745:717-1355(+)
MPPRGLDAMAAGGGCSFPAWGSAAPLEEDEAGGKHRRDERTDDIGGRAAVEPAAAAAGGTTRCDASRWRSATMCQRMSIRCTSHVTLERCARSSSAMAASSASNSFSSSLPGFSELAPPAAAGTPSPPSVIWRDEPACRLMHPRRSRRPGKKCSCWKARAPPGGLPPPAGLPPRAAGAGAVFEGSSVSVCRSARRKPYVYSCCTKEESLLCL